MNGPILVVGCGYLGGRVATAWRDRGRVVHVLTRSRAGELAAAGFHPIVGDVTDPASLSQLPKVDTVLYAVARDRSSRQSMHDVYVTGLSNVLAALPPPAKFLYVSSSSVYGQTAGEWVTEDSPTDPAEESGRVVLEAEQLLRSQVPAAIVLRFAGIYGPGRLLREKEIRAGTPLVGDADKWLNLIHVDDGVRAILAAEARAEPGEIYNVSDGEPVTRRDYYSELARILGAPPARFVPGPNARGQTHRRVSNAKAGERLEFVPQFPHYRAGLAASLGEPGASATGGSASSGR
jgi:nucleoside-diphosphate-sugar epimerase